LSVARTAIRPRAKRVIFLFMQGGPSQVDTFDYKPALDRHDGQRLAFDDARTIANTGGRGTEQRVMKSPWKFAWHGDSGRWVSELFPHVARHVDELCFIHSLQTEGVAHGPATLFDLADESPSTLAMYGIGEKGTDDFGRQCLLARRMCEAGVRFVQVTYGDNTANPRWDQHSDLPRHAVHAQATDKPVAGLLADLAQRGLLEDTLIWWGSEFGRTPYAEKNGTGRDHNPGGFTVWLAGAGVKRGFASGATDELGHLAVQDRVHLHDLHATILHLLGLDHERLTYRFDGRDYRLTDVHGSVIREILT
jgi:hypothetical protein